jgi:hypothetical protein
VDRPGALGPPWTDGGADRGGPGHGGALTGARPPAALVRQSSPAGAQQREEHTGSSSRASSGLERRRGGRATMVKTRWCWRSVRGRLERGEMRREAGSGVVTRGVVLAFYRGQGSAGEGWPRSLTPALMALTPWKTGEGLRGKLREGK